MLSLAVAAWCAAPAGASLDAGAPAPAGRAPIRAAFYYAWYPQNWLPGTRFTPLAGHYSSAELAQVRRQIRELRYARQDAGIVSWSGIGSVGDRRMPALLRAARGTPFKWAVYYEPEGRGDPSLARMRADVRHIARRFARHSSFLRVGARPVIFVYADSRDGPRRAAQWVRLGRALRVHLVLKVFPGYRGLRPQPPGWHQYAPAKPADRQRGSSFSVSPGFWLAGAPAPRLARDVARFRADVRAMVAAEDPWQLVTTYNEWGEGTAVEPAREWASPSGYGAYLDVLHAELA
jgi:glycosyl hydrolase family 99